MNRRIHRRGRKAKTPAINELASPAKLATPFGITPNNVSAGLKALKGASAKAPKAALMPSPGPEATTAATEPLTRSTITTTRYLALIIHS